MPVDAHYHSYLLRVWRDSAEQPWRASLHCSATGEKRLFADLGALFLFLVEELANDDASEQLVCLNSWLRSQIKFPLPK